jgi:hypothetical protein
MSTEKRRLWAELAVYGLAAYASYEMSKTPDQRLVDQLRLYAVSARICWRGARILGRLAMAAELAYWKGMP